MRRPLLNHVSVDERTKFIVIVLHALATWFMVGMIWTIHIVHYPLFAFVGSDTYEAFQAQHVNLIGRLLLLPWLVEGLTALALVFVLSGGKRKLAITGAALILVIMALSAFISAPAHGDLADGFDRKVHDDLMLGNLIRAGLWTVRGGLATAILWCSLGSIGSRSNYSSTE